MAVKAALISKLFQFLDMAPASIEFDTPAIDSPESKGHCLIALRIERANRIKLQPSFLAPKKVKKV